MSYKQKVQTNLLLHGLVQQRTDFRCETTLLLFQNKLLWIIKRVKSPTKVNTDLHDGGIILTNKTSTFDPL